MKVFLKKILVFALLILVMSGIVISVNYSLVQSMKFSFGKDKEILVLGDSNSRNAINDTVFSRALNFSGSADSYFYSFLKLNKILEDKSHNFQTVFLSFSPHNLIDNGWVYNEENMVTRFPKYSPLMDRDDVIFLFNDKRDVFLSSLGRIFRELPNIFRNRIKGSLVSDYGAFEPVNNGELSVALDKLSKDEPIPHFTLPNDFKISPQETLYLKKIVTLCRRHHLNLILFNPPKRKELLRHKKYFVSEFNQFYNSELKDVTFLDFSAVIMPDEFYNDLVHLNYKGAAYFSDLLETHELAELIKAYQHRN